MIHGRIKSSQNLFLYFCISIYQCLLRPIYFHKKWIAVVSHFPECGLTRVGNEMFCKICRVIPEIGLITFMMFYFFFNIYIFWIYKCNLINNKRIPYSLSKCFPQKIHKILTESRITDIITVTQADS